MAHDFSIRRKLRGTHELHLNISAWFYGYANGVMYKAFDKTHCDMGCSGDGSDYIISREQAIQGLEKAIEMFDNMDYPDKTRMDDIKDFLNKLKNSDDDKEEYIIMFD